jgi:hypothetical protein
MRRLAVCILASLACLSQTGWAQGVVATDADLLARGQRLYREGVLPAGGALRGISQAGVTLSGASAACATCHRRSGWGSSEGPIEVRPITGTALFGERVAPDAPGNPVDAAVPVDATEQAALSPADAARARAAALRTFRTATLAGTRPRVAYDDTTLARAITEGLDASGRRMNPSMPRYDLAPADLQALTAYLKTLSTESAPGITEGEVHLATVIQPGTDPEQRRAMVEVLQTYFNDRNRGLRSEVKREQSGQVRLRRVVREWVLHVWDLSGPSDTWGAQLEQRYKGQPVFALISGLGNASWRPIHEFSERFEVPCIFPQTDAPALEGPNVYTVYLSKGTTLEGQALASHLADAGPDAPVVQVWRRDDASAAAAAAFRQARTAGGNSAPVDRVIDDVPGEAYWQSLARQTPGASLVLWLSPRDLAHAQAVLAAGSHVGAVYLSASLVGERRTGLAADGEGRVRIVYPQDLPAAREVRIEVVKRWLRNNGIALTDEPVQMNAYLAATVTGMELSHGRDTHSREFLLERVEHRLGTALEPSIYPRLSLGPGQRYASKGSYIVRVGGAEAGQLTPVSDWIVP